MSCTENKQQILNSIRRQTLETRELPAPEHSWVTYADRQRQFSTMLEAVGGRAVSVPNIEALNRELEQMPAFAEAKKICSLIPGIAERSNVDLAAIEDPHQLDDVDFAVLPGQFAVAENAAVWVTDEGMRHRALYFIVQHLALVVAADKIVDNMHQAYERLAFEHGGFGTFLSGPSKTADIEQSLVIGAHGPRSLTVFLLEA